MQPSFVAYVAWVDEDAHSVPSRGRTALPLSSQSKVRLRRSKDYSRDLDGKVFSLGSAYHGTEFLFCAVNKANTYKLQDVNGNKSGQWLGGDGSYTVSADEKTAAELRVTWPSPFKPGKDPAVGLTVGTKTLQVKDGKLAAGGIVGTIKLQPKEANAKYRWVANGSTVAVSATEKPTGKSDIPVASPAMFQFNPMARMFGPADVFYGMTGLDVLEKLAQTGCEFCWCRAGPPLCTHHRLALSRFGHDFAQTCSSCALRQSFGFPTRSRMARPSRRIPWGSSSPS